MNNAEIMISNNIDITKVLLVAAIVIVLIMIYKDCRNVQSLTTLHDVDQKFPKILENYVPNIDGDFNKYAQVNDPYYHMTPPIGWLSRRGLLPWWNSTRDTKNMSYDIRGDIPPFRYPVGPWLNSAIVDHPYSYREIF